MAGKRKGTGFTHESRVRIRISRPGETPFEQDEFVSHKSKAAAKKRVADALEYHRENPELHHLQAIVETEVRQTTEPRHGNEVVPKDEETKPAPRRFAGAAKTPKPPPPKAPEEAVRWFAKQVPFTRPEVDQLDGAARKRAFYVSNVTQLRLVSEVHKAISRAIEKGTTLADFKRTLGAKLAAEWGGEKPAAVETIFRTNIQTAYNAGRLEQFEDPLIKRLRPYRSWAVVVDNRTTEHICLPLRAVVVPADSAFAKSHVPPLHFRCRTGIMALGADAQGAVRSPEHIPDVPVQDGFGGDPRSSPKEFVDVGNEPAGLRRLFMRKLEAKTEPDSV